MRKIMIRQMKFDRANNNQNKIIGKYSTIVTTLYYQLIIDKYLIYNLYLYEIHHSAYLPAVLYKYFPGRKKPYT